MVKSIYEKLELSRTHTLHVLHPSYSCSALLCMLLVISVHESLTTIIYTYLHSTCAHGQKG